MRDATSLIPRLLRRAQFWLTVSFLLSAGGAMAGSGGELDPTFGDGGRVMLGDTASARVIMQIPGEDKLLMAGHKGTAVGGTDFMITRLNMDGAVDTTFGQNGIVTVDFDGGWDAARALAVQADGKIIAAGTTENGALGYSRIALVRLNANGSLDAGYGVGGRVSQALVGGWEALADIEIDDTGGVVVALNASDMVFARFDTAGRLDLTFGAGPVPGTTAIDIRDDRVFGLLRQPDGKLVACGAILHGEFTYDGLMSAVRLNPDGSRDTTFGTNGVWQGGGEFFFTGANDCGLMADGSVVLAGFGGGIGKSHVLTAILDSSGALATERWHLGTSAIDFASVAYAEALAVLDDGYLALAGTAKYRDEEGTLAQGDMFVTLIEPATGLADPGFGHKGVTVIDFDDIQPTNASGGPHIIQQADGKLVIAGYALIPGGVGDGLVPAGARLSRGEIDPSGFLGSYERKLSMAETDGEVVVTVLRAGGSSGAVTLDYETFPGTASVIDDFAYSTGTLSWGDADTEPRSIRVTVSDDELSEAAESFEIRFSNTPLGLANEAVEITILENDRPPAVSPPAPPPAIPNPPPSVSGGGGALNPVVLLLLLLARLSRPRRRVIVPTAPRIVS